MSRTRNKCKIPNCDKWGKSRGQDAGKIDYSNYCRKHSKVRMRPKEDAKT